MKIHRGRCQVANIHYLGTKKYAELPVRRSLGYAVGLFGATKRALYQPTKKPRLAAGRRDFHLIQDVVDRMRRQLVKIAIVRRIIGAERISRRKGTVMGPRGDEFLRTSPGTDLGSDAILLTAFIAHERRRGSLRDRRREQPPQANVVG